MSRTRSWKWRVIAIAASAAITVGVIMATHGGSSPTVAPPPPNVITISPGPITIGGPH